MVYQITIDSFQGPLDLLLHLIEKNKLDIYDIPISKITDQYMEYIKQWKELNLDVTSEFLVMASTLLEIKSRELLPKKNMAEEQEEEGDPRQELIEKLIEYRKYKNISQYLKNQENIERKVLYKDPEYFPEFEEINKKIDIELDLLCMAFKNILLKQDLLNKDVELFHEIELETYTVQEKMQTLLEQINQYKSINFSTLFTYCNSKNELITTFLAILELAKLKSIKIMQNSLFGDFIIYKIKNGGA
ncbi:MAG TPA: segregation/condensation protein A [Eubacteriaceae bacterium]|nr:segregation/condensation protein A [Eubacteriaceae bacterium]